MKLETEWKYICVDLPKEIAATYPPGHIVSDTIFIKQFRISHPSHRIVPRDTYIMEEFCLAKQSIRIKSFRSCLPEESMTLSHSIEVAKTVEGNEEP